MRRERWIGCAILFAALAVVACNDSESPPLPPEETGRLVFLSLVHPAVVATLGPSLLRAGAYVGPDLCWRIDAAQIEVRDSELRLTGTAVRRATGGACPQAIAYDSVDVLVPPLRAGTYVIRADSLADTLVVAPVVGALVERFAAEGVLTPSLVAGGCTTFTGEGLQQLRGVVLDPPVVAPGTACRLYGEIAADVVCQGAPQHAFRFRRMQSGVAPPWERR
jgi:hypothetical protein